MLPTYRCTAACENCCFDSNPHVKGRIPLDRLLAYVDEAAELGTVRSVVISGGEAFTLGKDLDAVIERATSRGLSTRVVTNGYWATSRQSATARITRLVDVGLSELNLSTGDYHLAFVPLERVVNAAQACVECGLKVLIVVEQRHGRRMVAKDLRNHPGLLEAFEPKKGRARLTLVESPWMPRGEAMQGLKERRVDAGPPVPQESESLLTRANLETRRGCASVLNSLVVTPHERLGACCGLPREEIPELDLGSARDAGLAALFERGRTDFLKLWLAVEGPEHILAWAAEHDSTIEWEGRFAHQCDACRAVYKLPEVRAVIQKHYREKLPEVLLRFAALDRTGKKTEAARPGRPRRRTPSSLGTPTSSASAPSV